MENKYYDLIVSLIKAHRKYPSIEHVLDVVVSEVWSQAKMTIDSVQNEDIILSYLNRVVTTSIVSVTKRLNINTRTSTPLSDLSINVNQKSIKADLLEPSVNIEQTDLKEIPITFETNSVHNNLGDVSKDESFEKENELVELEIVEPDRQQEVQNLVDKMINGVDTSKKSESNLELEIDNEIDIELDDNFIIEEEEEEEEEKGYNDDKQVIEDAVENNNFEPVESLELESVEDFEDFVVDNSFNNEGSFELELDEKITNQETELHLESDFIESVDDIENLIVDNGFDTVESLELELDENISYQDVELQLENDFLEDNEDNEVVEIDNNESTKQEHNLASSISDRFSCFDFSPELTDFNIDEFLEELHSFNEKYPDKKVLEICDLKFNNHLTIQEISNSLDISEENILAILNEIVDLVEV